MKNLFTEIYFKNISDRSRIKDLDSFIRLLNVLASSIGSYTNPTNSENTFKAEINITYGHIAIKNHIEYMKDAILLSEALTNFRQDEPTHIMENIIYNEPINRGYYVDIGIVEIS